MDLDKLKEFAEKLSKIIDFELREEEWELSQIQKYPNKKPTKIIFFLTIKKK